MPSIRRHLVPLALLVALTLATSAVAEDRAPEYVYTGALVSYPGPWSFQIGKQGIILVDDQQLDDLTDPDKPVNLSLTGEPRVETLRQICERAKAAGQRTIIFAFDHFFSQYREKKDTTPRKYLPDTDAYIERMSKIGTFAKEYGLGFELSLLSPLEIGRGYRAATGESGMWLHYRKGVRDPKSGAFSVELWQQRRWSNNKGPIDVEDAGVRVFAFSDRRLGGTPFRLVDPNAIVEITDIAKVEKYDGAIEKHGDYEAVRIRVHGEGRTDIGGHTRVLVVQQYRTPELDYFSPNALPFLTNLVDRYTDAGVTLNGLYADEMHIQQDWGYFDHHDNGEFALRYMTPSMAKKFAELYGEQYTDFAKYMVYFAYGQEDFTNDIYARQDAMHVFGDTPEAIRESALFRSRYYRLLQDGVVDLFTQAKHYAEKRRGFRLEARAHATWAQSPTIDRWDSGSEGHQRNQYEYTSNFIWSNTVQQSSAACSDYFKWGDFLTGNGNDHTEGGYLDRNYYGLAIACSTGILNEIPYSYGAHWGMPNEISRRRAAVQTVYGAAGSHLHGAVQDLEHRDVQVLMLYPMDLVSVDERFGSWMSLYGYANFITQQKLVEMGTVNNGGIDIAGRRFTTLVALFEPFPSQALLDMMKTFAQQGGHLIWSSAPPVFNRDGQNVLAQWQDLFNVDYTPQRAEGKLAPGREVVFEGALKRVPSQSILTHFTPDHIFPVTPRTGASVVAKVKDDIVGVKNDALPNVVYLGFRPRDDQSASLGMETRTWFEVLNTLGAYPATGAFPSGNDNTEFVSRNSDYIVARFPNGTVSLAHHLKALEEDWAGGFARNEEQDKKYLDKMPPPSEQITLNGFSVNGHTIAYNGVNTLSYRVDANGALVGFCGESCNAITIDGKETKFADAPLGLIAYTPVPESRRVAGGAVMQLLVYGQGEVRIPATNLPANVAAFAEGTTPGSRGTAVPARIENGNLILDPAPAGGRWIYIVPA